MTATHTLQASVIRVLGEAPFFTRSESRAALLAAQRYSRKAIVDAHQLDAAEAALSALIDGKLIARTRTARTGHSIVSLTQKGVDALAGLA